MLRPCTRTSLCKRRSIVAELVESSAQYSMAASQHCYSRACTASDHLCGRRFLRPSLFSHRLRHRIDPVIHASTAASTSSAGPAKSKLSQLAGRKYGHNLTESQKQDVRGVIKELEALQSGSVPQQNLAGTNWQLLYTESTGSSGGIVGPFVGQVDQVFLGSSSTSTGVYVNKLQLGPIRADLSATYKFSASDKIDVNFIDIAAYLGPLRLVHKDFGGRGGFWKLTYSDDDLRILYTNQGNVFVLKRANY